MDRQNAELWRPGGEKKMNIPEFMTELQNILQRDEPIQPEDTLADMEEWDSMSIMSCMVWYESRLGIRHPFKFYQELKTVQDLINATEGQIEIYPDTFSAIQRNADRISIISKERIVDELMKIMASPIPSIGWTLLSDSGLLRLIFPELQALRGVEIVKGRGHKDNFFHTLAVLDKVASKSTDVWLRWAALMHDIAKPVTKRWDENIGWTFHNHNFVGAKMVPRIFRTMKLPLNDKMKYVAKLVELHMRPIALVEDEVTDSAVRRLIHDAGDDVSDLMTLCEADITSKNAEKVKRHLENFAHVRQKMIELEAKDHIRNFQPPVDGDEIMTMFGLTPSREVGILKAALKDAILDGIIPNERTAALQFVIEKAATLGFHPIG